ncbi:MAG: hypothetical protein P8Z00_03285 [Anaerolineales bacterium]|jgi:hypothetical protein
MVKRFRPWLIVIVVIAVGLWARSTLPAYDSPEQAARQYWTRLNQYAPSPLVGFRVLDQRVLGERVLVISSYSLGKEGDSIQNAGYAFVKEGPFGWYVSSAQSVGKSPLPDLVLYAVDRKDGDQLAYGQILSADVAAVEVLFVNGETRRDAGTNGGFAILFPQGRQFAELRVIGQQGEILQRYSQPSSLD